ncbi:MAG: C4-type zinc ribbon domain-containing protein [Spirochaetales bacterium]
MEATFEKLRSLQEILFAKFRLEKEINEIPKALVTKTEVLNRAKKSFIEKNEAAEAMKGKVRRLNIELSDATKKREDFEKQMDLIKTQKEYEALDKEIREATEKEQSLRKDIVKEENDLEELLIGLEKLEKQINLDEQELKEESDKIQAEGSSKKNRLTELTSEERTITPGMDEDILFKFERIIKSKEGLGIVPIVSGVCSGCHIILPMQFVNEVRMEKEVKFCPYCSRILYFQSGMDPEKRDQIEAGSLAELIEDEEPNDDEE